MKVQLQIRGKGRDFQLQSSFLRGQRCGDVKDIILRPQEDYPVHVLFLPSMVAGCEAKLQVKAREENSKYYVSDGNPGNNVCHPGDDIWDYCPGDLSLTHEGLNKMADIAVSWKKAFSFRFKFHLSLFLVAPFY